MTAIRFINARVVDGSIAERGDPVQVLVEGDTIREMGVSISAPNAETIDLKHRTLMPGLIDCHVHVIAGSADLGLNARLPDSLVMGRAIAILRGMLMRGFTTVRDVGGADHGLRLAAGEGHFLVSAPGHFRQGAEPDRRPL